jgi:hypothetical protein
VEYVRTTTEQYREKDSIVVGYAYTKYSKNLKLIYDKHGGVVIQKVEVGEKVE